MSFQMIDESRRARAVANLQKRLQFVDSSAAPNVAANDTIKNERLVREGQLFDTTGLVVVGEKWGLSCDEKSFAVWIDHTDELEICTGYALSDGLNAWYRHTWCVDKAGKIYECTSIPREKYYGIRLDFYDAKDFMEDILVDPEKLEMIRKKYLEIRSERFREAASKSRRS